MSDVIMLCQNLRSKNDVNGNPKRLWVVYQLVKPSHYSPIVEVYEEGYRGRPAELTNMVELPMVDIVPSEYRRIKDRAQELGHYHHS